MKVSLQHVGFAVTMGGTDLQVAPDTVVKEEVDLPWNVVILDDPVNLMSYVTLVIQRIFGYPKSKAARMMREVHEQGRSIVWTGVRETAEFYVQQIHGHQLRAVIERVES
jgi:ATP-dependent Clp protease adaptor protein ClpS